jgi:long-subunit fatty acid transport protein
MLVATTLSSVSLARAGGFETPDNGTEALGRGAAFTAKASDGTALTYNVAGLAEQRGTRVLIDGKMSIDNYSFARAGVYPDARSAQTPWGNSFFPTVSNQGGPFFAPFAAISTDFGYFDRLTFAVGAFGPSGVGNPTYPIGVGGAPSPARYDVVQATSTIVLPTIAAAYRVTDWLDLGVAFHYVYGSFNLTNVSFADLPGSCPNVEFTFCDTTNHLTMSGATVSGSFGALAHVTDWLDAGLNVRAPISLTAHGTVVSTAPAVAPAQGTSTGPVAFQTSLPAQVRLGLRAKVMDGRFEQGDVELDGVYEPWASTGAGPTVSIPALTDAQGPSSFAPINTTVLHNFLDVYSVRLGGAYNIRTSDDTILTLRAGGYYESPSSAPADTRVDFNTLEKFAGTIGVGFQFHGVGLNVAYAGIYSPERVVTDGEIRPINPVAHGQSSATPGGPLFPAVNNGTYKGFIDMIAFGVKVEVETLFGTSRSKRWTPQGELPSSGEPEAQAAAEAKPQIPEPKAAAAPAPNADEKAPRIAPARPAQKAASTPAPPDEPAPARRKKPAKPDNEDQKERRLEDPFAK